MNTKELNPANPFLFPLKLEDQKEYDVRFLLYEIEFGGPMYLISAIDTFIFDYLAQNIEAKEEIDNTQLKNIQILKRLRDALMRGAGMPTMISWEKTDKEEAAKELERHIQDFAPASFINSITQ